MRGFEVQELGVGDNMSGLVWFMEWTSVLVIILPIPKKKKTGKQNTGKQRGRAAQQKITIQSKLFHCVNRSENKLTINDSPFRLLLSFPVKS